MATVTAYVYVMDGGASKLLRPGDTVPDGVTVTNPAVLADEPKPTPAPTPTPAKKATGRPAAS